MITFCVCIKTEDVNCLLQNPAIRQCQKCILHCDSYFQFKPPSNEDMNYKSEEAMGKGAIDDGNREKKIGYSMYA